MDETWTRRGRDVDETWKRRGRGGRKTWTRTTEKDDAERTYNNGVGWDLLATTALPTTKYQGTFSRKQRAFKYTDIADDYSSDGKNDNAESKMRN